VSKDPINDITKPAKKVYAFISVFNRISRQNIKEKDKFGRKKTNRKMELKDQLAV
jgi:rRNA processing protein Gar1